MEQLSIKFYNYSPDFSNENLVKRSTNLFKDIKTKNVVGFENFGFHDLAMNFSYENYEELEKFSENIHSKEIKKVIIFCSSKDFANFNSANQFLFKNDLLKNQKIQYLFFVDEEQYNYANLYQSFLELKNLKNIAFLFIGNTSYSQTFLNLIKLIINDFQINLGYYNALNNCYLISKNKLEKQLNFLDILEENKLIIPDILTNSYSLFSEYNMFLLLLKGADILGIYEGYQEGCRNWSYDDISKNESFQYAYVKHMIKKYSSFNLLISNNIIMHNTLSLQNSYISQLYSYRKYVSNYAIFPEDIYTYGQYILDNNKNLYVTYYSIKNEKFDYRLSDEINHEDGLKKDDNNVISNFKFAGDNGVMDVLANIATVPSCLINLKDNSEYNYGILISFIYWSLIYEAYLDKINPFGVK
ncbi:Glucose-6-phosphate isomerase [Mycoplasmopsis maculosa]|uniref:Glucose-6-phosphate isomerase n=1 Tax=Mycoplasmopsis maculosa TaxID=114885 RepID=A0A449B3Y1_9BACT|nr:glucose-6-phosphate isomerase [Mycoplasmopsis maculosa]VEU75275.1 Glucose-6-phosphate isomerase [Mycoplasmopsis maculosa]